MVMRKVFMIALALMTLVVAGCSASVGTSGVHINTGDGNTVPSDWQTVTYDQYDGRKLSLELPYQLKEDKDCFIKDPDIDKQEYLDRFEGGLWTSIYHLSFGDPDLGLNFGIESFGLNLDKDFHPELKKMEKRTINGQEVIYAEINMVNHSNKKLMVKCLGFDMDSEYWIIRYVYGEADKELQEVVDRSMQSITIK